MGMAGSRSSRLTPGSPDGVRSEKGHRAAGAPTRKATGHRGGGGKKPVAPLATEAGTERSCDTRQSQVCGGPQLPGQPRVPSATGKQLDGACGVTKAISSCGGGAVGAHTCSQIPTFTQV